MLLTGRSSISSRHHWNESADTTTILTVGPTITNSIGEIWAFNGSAQVVVNGVADTGTSGVIKLYYTYAFTPHRVYQKNNSNNWFYKAVSSDGWTADADPTSDGSSVFTPIDGTYALTFDEEFNGTSLDGTKWFSQNSNNFNNAPARTANVTVAGSVCTLALAGSVASFTGAYIHTGDATSPKFLANSATGAFYIEGRCRMPADNSTGFWPAFWMNTSQAAAFWPEVDMCEWLGVYPDGMPRTFFKASGAECYHWGSGTGDQPQDSALGLGHLGVAYHIYGMWYQPGVSISYYIDGILRGTAVQGVTQSNYNSGSGGIIDVTSTNTGFGINLTAGANGYGGSNNLGASTTFPGLFKIDYVHVYQKNMSAITPQANYGGPGSTAGPTT